MRLTVRVGASREIGSGHVMRMIALAQSWRKIHGPVVFALGDDCPRSLISRIEKEGFLQGAGFDMSETDVVVYDGYQFGAAIQMEAVNEGKVVAYMDDFGHLTNYPADYVINQNPYASSSLYHGSTLTGKLLAGSKFVLLRSEFTSRHRPAQRKSAIRKILVCIGGGDPSGLSGQVLEALNEIISPDLEIRLISSIGFHDSSLSSAVEETRHLVSLLEGCDDMFFQYEWADMVVTAAGCSVWECIFMQVPFAFFCVADNQELNTQTLRASSAGCFLDRESDWRNTLRQYVLNGQSNLKQSDSSAGGKSFEGDNLQIEIDGYGGDRVCAYLADKSFWIRRITPDDCHWIWVLANDREIRSASFSDEPIPWDSHQQWFANMLDSSDTEIYVGIDRETERPVGYVRFYSEEAKRVVVSLALDVEFRGRSLAPLLLRSSERYFTNELAFSGHFSAWVKSSNIASQKTFERCGYSNVSHNGDKNSLYFMKQT